MTFTRVHKLATISSRIRSALNRIPISLLTRNARGRKMPQVSPHDLLARARQLGGKLFRDDDESSFPSTFIFTTKMSHFCRFNGSYTTTTTMTTMRRRRSASHDGEGGG